MTTQTTTLINWTGKGSYIYCSYTNEVNRAASSERGNGRDYFFTSIAHAKQTFKTAKAMNWTVLE